jgi:hypothetical protein
VTKYINIVPSGGAVANTYMIADLHLPSLDECWSGDNGCDGFGKFEDDQEMSSVRHRYGETMDNLPGTPRLILYRLKQGSLLMAKIWLTRSFRDLLDTHLVWASLAKAMRHVPPSSAQVEFIDWHGNVPGATLTQEDRFELSIEIVGLCSSLTALKTIYKTFMKTFDHAEPTHGT